VSLQFCPKAVGMDMGLKDLLVTNTGFKQNISHHTAKYAARLSLLQWN